MECKKGIPYPTRTSLSFVEVGKRVGRSYGEKMWDLIVRTPGCCLEKCHSSFSSVTVSLALSKSLSLSISEMVANHLLISLTKFESQSQNISRME